MDREVLVYTWYQKDQNMTIFSLLTAVLNTCNMICVGQQICTMGGAVFNIIVNPQH